jgi:uncharacterized repeat protein (TIGR01451 family)
MLKITQSLAAIAALFVVGFAGCATTREVSLPSQNQNTPGHFQFKAAEGQFAMVDVKPEDLRKAGWASPALGPQNAMPQASMPSRNNLHMTNNDLTGSRRAMRDSQVRQAAEFSVSDDSNEGVVLQAPKNTQNIIVPSAPVVQAPIDMQIRSQLPPGAVIVGETPGSDVTHNPVITNAPNGNPGIVPPGAIHGSLPYGASIKGTLIPTESGEFVVGGCPPMADAYDKFPAGVPLAQTNCGTNWRPNGAECPWPADEYLCDGGDRLARVRVQDDWTVQGIDQQDTVAHFDTADGRVMVEPTNKVCIYAPRFASVRRVDSVYSDDRIMKATGVEKPVGPIRINENLAINTALQPIGPNNDTGSKRTTIYDANDRGIPIAQDLRVFAVNDRVKPAQDFRGLAALHLDMSQTALLQEKAIAAITWTSDQKVQCIIDGQKAAADEGVQRPQLTFRVDLPGNPRLRITKAASTSSATTGDTVDFVLRFDNIGDQVIGNVTIIDNLVTRLEYVDGSQQSSRTADFKSTANTGESLVLRWEITDPIKPGEGGVIVFKCKVR